MELLFFAFVASCSWLCAPALAGEVSANPTELTVNSWTVEDGLPGNAVYALAPNKEGYLWVAGLNGLARFDGARFVRFRLWEGLPSLQTLHVLEDRVGRLWIGTDDAGVILRENGRFRSFARTN